MTVKSPWYLLPLSKANILVSTGTFLYVILTRSFHAAYFGIGTLLCSLSGTPPPPPALSLPVTANPHYALAKALKRLLRHPRPPGSPRPLTYGMPSTHTSAMAFQSLYLTLSSLFLSFTALSFLPLPLLPTPASPPEWLRLALPGLYVPYALAVAASRITMGHHTLPQVLGGALWGVVFAAGWWALWPWAKELGEKVLPWLGGRVVS
ncbi:hypothetical protein DACRYDRAFT_117624 [Dacryopinax primogenitus]|uniref:Phosphatidic acid phosphatase type 2/haloperoxidase domain-containing protein n=1 Tax=Dacryopinax primogenitus (strain DJM 731) TaxID=1858805 RepID=M5FRY5_DACPD|nr:uncharacterized protein DACRYDRAFT_117624 [Dacryopinax primogenitus]EJU00026.1 hypothetical protein DACRYDRAFT_117624 [Dacryopinax primogenitus]